MAAPEIRGFSQAAQLKHGNPVITDDALLHWRHNTAKIYSVVLVHLTLRIS